MKKVSASGSAFAILKSALMLWENLNQNKCLDTIRPIKMKLIESTNQTSNQFYPPIKSVPVVMESLKLCCPGLEAVSERRSPEVRIFLGKYPFRPLLIDGAAIILRWSSSSSCNKYMIKKLKYCFKALLNALHYWFICRYIVRKTRNSIQNPSIMLKISIGDISAPSSELFENIWGEFHQISKYFFWGIFKKTKNRSTRLI